MSQAPVTDVRSSGAPARVVRHALADRVFHWLTAACVLTLLGTAFLPILGLKFDWVMVHWMTGLVLIGAVLFHLVRSVFWQTRSRHERRLGALGSRCSSYGRFGARKRR